MTSSLIGASPTCSPYYTDFCSGLANGPTLELFNVQVSHEQYTVFSHSQ